MASDLEYLREHCNTARQEEVLDAVMKHGGNRGAALALGVSLNAVAEKMATLRKRAAAKGHAPGHWNDGTAPGYRMGKVTVQRGPDGVERVWERQHPEARDWTEIFATMLEAMTERPAAKPKVAPVDTSDLMNVIPIGDPHFGSYSWAAETGEAYDLERAKFLHIEGVRELIRAMPTARECVLINLGDMFDSNDSKNRTPRSGHVMDAHGTYGQILAAACDATVQMIDLCLKKCRNVEYVPLEGNHDPEASAALAVYIHAYYRNEPRVTTRLLPYVFWYRRFGSVLLGAHHGHGCKPESLPLVMAEDRREDWGASKYRQWIIGHFHHPQLIGKGYGSTKVEGFNTLAANNKHHHDSGYRGPRTITGIVYDEHGEKERHTRNVAAIEAAAEPA